MSTPSSYTVLLLRPDYVADVYGQDTYMAWCKGDSVEEAIRRAQWEVAAIDEVDDLDDYFVLAVFEGHLTSLC